MNTDNIAKLIAHLEADDGSHFIMERWVGHLPHVQERIVVEKRKLDPSAEYDSAEDLTWVECGTACCFAGWANLLALAEAGVDVKQNPVRKGLGFIEQFSNVERAARWLGLEPHSVGANQLFLMREPGDSYGAADRRVTAFSELPPAQRRRAGIELLEHLSRTGEVDWPRAIAIGQAYIG